MKTLTEFDSFKIGTALKKLQELATENKTPEEISAAMSEAFKVEGDKLKFLTHAVDLAKDKTRDGDAPRVKRILVMTLNEGEKAPHGAIQKEEHWYMAEFFPAPPRPKNARGPRPERGDRPRDGKKGQKKGFDKRRGRGPRRDGQAGEGAPQAGAEAAGARPARKPRPPRAPRPPRPEQPKRPPRDPNQPLVFKPASAVAAAASTPSVAPAENATSEASSS